MWADNFQKYNEEPKSILTPNNIALNGRVNIIDTPDQLIQKRIQLFEKVNVKSSITDYREALNNIWEESKLSNLFFSSQNIQLIQNTLKNEVYKLSKGKYKLLPQNEDNLKIIMRSYYLQYTENQVGNEENELKRINGLVLNYLIPRLMNESIAYEKYLIDQSSLVIPFNRGLQVDRDYKELELNPFF